MIDTHKARLIVLLLLSTLLNCVSVSADSADNRVATAPLSTAKDQSATRQHSGGIQEILPDDFRPAFTRDTVIKLNGIVERSYLVISELDQLRGELRGSSLSDASAMARSGRNLNDRQSARIASLHQRSRAALKDMNAAVDQLQAGEEYYNSAVLAGMVMFVNDVEQEVSQFDKNG